MKRSLLRRPKHLSLELTKLSKLSFTSTAILQILIKYLINKKIVVEQLLLRKVPDDKTIANAIFISFA
jgi:hypothetical protein